ncbi:unnamed protein product [Rotaria sp. Silwood2]|nr:unnamed protein product [Rotaria sp. Silwood2]
MQSTFEKLSDEILMIIFSYLDNIYSIFRTFLGLNQRINNILLDKRLHLLINFLCINVDPEIIYSYYNSLEVQQVTQTLMLLNGTTNNNEIVQCLESLVCFHIKNQYTRLDKEFQLNRDNFQSIRKQLSNSEIQNVDNELKIAFNKLEHTSNTIQQIHTLLYIRGAHLECNEDQMRSFDLVRAINCQMLIYYKSTLYHSRKKFYHLISIFKGFIISNPNLLKIFYYLGYGFNVVHCLLFTIFQRRFIYSNQLCTTNLYYYQSLVELVLLSIRTIVNDGSWSESYFFEILNIIKLNKESMNSTSDIIFRTTEIELLKILLDQSNVHMAIPWNENTNDSFTRALNHLIKNDCMNIVRMITTRNYSLNTWSGENASNVQPLKQCRYGASCYNQSDPTHCASFQHPTRTSSFVAAATNDTKSSNTNSNTSLSNTKQECRYGASCHDQSDPTHCARFQHPTRTSSFVAAATNDTQSSNTSRSFRIHTNHSDDDIEREHSIRGAMNSGRSNKQDETTIKSMREDAVTVSPFSNTKKQCKYGASCHDQSDPTHCARFQHPTRTSSFVAAATNDTQSSNVNSNTALSNTKKQCRYGASCHDQSDPTHCDRFQHPTRTSSFVAEATNDTQSSNTNLNTARSSRIHTNHGDDDMQKAYRIGGAIALERLSQQDQTTIKNMREDAVIVVPGTYDHIDQVLTKLNLKFSIVQQHELINYPFRAYQTVYINCASNFPKEAAHRLREFVDKGLHIITTDWALRNVLQVAFSDFVRHNGQSTRDEVVGIEVVDPNHPFVNGFVLAAKHAQPQWWLETGSHPIEIVNKEDVKVLIRSQALHDKYHSDAVIVTFDCGQGNVTHMISHFYLQRSETANTRHKMPAQQYAQDIKASDNITKLITKDGQNLNYAQIQSSSTSAQFIYNLVSNRLNSTNQSTSSTHSRKHFQ